MSAATSPSSSQLSIESKIKGDKVISQECQDLISTLPKEIGWLQTEICYYQGFWCIPSILQGTLNCQKHFQAHETDIILATAPKAGTTWLKALTYALINRSSLFLTGHTNLEEEEEEDQKNPLLNMNPHDLIPLLEQDVYGYDQVPPDLLSSMPSPRIFNTHLPVTSLPTSVTDSGGCKVVYLCREPKDNFVSYWHFFSKWRPKEIGPMPLEDAFDSFIKGVHVYGPFWDNVLGYWNASLEKPQKILFLKYEDLKVQPEQQVRRLAEFIGFPFSMEEEKQGTVEKVIQFCSFDHLSNLKANRAGVLHNGVESKEYFRKGQVGDWVNYLPPAMAQKIDQITEEKFGESGLKF